jgi:uncharacterized damage-inducible protein DinB
MPAGLLSHFQMLASYNRLANERLYAVCAQLPDAEYRKERSGSFSSIHRTLNHILLGDRIWMARFEGCGFETPPLDSVLYEDFPALDEARRKEDARIESFLAGAGDEFFERSIEYRNSAGRVCNDPVRLLLAHMFNHQTHHRGQVHVMLSDVPVQPPSLDMHRVIRP